MNLYLSFIKRYIDISRMKKRPPYLISYIEHLRYYKRIDSYSLGVYLQTKAEQIRRTWECIGKALRSGNDLTF